MVVNDAYVEFFYIKTADSGSDTVALLKKIFDFPVNDLCLFKGDGYGWRLFDHMLNFSNVSAFDAATADSEFRIMTF